MRSPDYIDFTHGQPASGDQMSESLARAGLPEGYVTVDQVGTPVPDFDDPATMLEWMKFQNGGNE